MSTYLARHSYILPDRMLKVGGQGCPMGLVVEEQRAESASYPLSTSREVGGDRNADEYNARTVANLAWRHNGGMNFLRSDGSVIMTKPGNSGEGADIIWFYYEGLGYRKDGVNYTFPSS